MQILGYVCDQTDETSCDQAAGQCWWTARRWAHDNDEPQERATKMGRLFDLIQEHVDSQPYEVTLAQVAKRIGVSRQTILNWRTPTKLIDKRHLVAVSELTGVRYSTVLDALLEDIGYLRPDEPPSQKRDAG